MESNVWEYRIITTAITQEELKREYRLSKQIVAMHFSLCDDYKFYSKFSEIILLSASVIFLSTTFADSQLFTSLGFEPKLAKLFLGITSVFAFICSLALMLLRWPEKAALHKESAEKWGYVVNKFRSHKLSDGTWPAANAIELNDAYINASENTIDIPDKKFNKLKAKYLKKIEISKLISKHPGVPYFISWSIIVIKATYKAVF